MTAHYIDPSRGDNSDGSTWAKAYTDTTWLSAHTFAAGDEIVFACDADIQLGGTATAMAMAVGDSGTEASPVLVYSDIPTGSGLTGGYARLRHYKETVTGDWTWDAVKNGWELTGITPSFLPCYWIDVAGTTDTPVKITSLPLAADYEVYVLAASSKLWLYAPSDTNPVTYYGSVRVGVRVPFYLNNTSHWHFSGLEFIEAGHSIVAAASANTMTGIYVDNCKLTNACNLLRVNGHTSYVINDTRITRCVADLCGIVGYNYVNWTNSVFSHNTINRPNRIAVPQGAVYWGIGSTSEIATYGTCKNNKVTNGLYGRGARGFTEGCCFYLETGAGYNQVHSNTVIGAHFLFQDNSGAAGNIVHGNVMIGDALGRTDDADAHGTRGLAVYNNTLYAETYRQYVEGTSGAAAYPMTVSGASGTVTFKNNLMISTNETYTHPFNITNGAQTYTIESNALSGLTGTLLYGGVPTALDASNLVYSSLSLDASYYCKNVTGIGAWLSGIRAYDDLPLPLHPDIGAVQDRDAAGRRFGVGGGVL